MVGLLAAVGVAMSALVSFVHGDSLPFMIVGASGATGLAAYLAAPVQKKALVRDPPRGPAPQSLGCLFRIQKNYSLMFRYAEGWNPLCEADVLLRSA
jgi:hypothetical protein